MSRPTARIVVQVMVVLAGVFLLFCAWHCDVHWFERHVQEFRCMRDARGLRRAMFWRCLAGVLAALLILVVRPFLGRWAGKYSGRQLLVGTPRIVLPAILALGVCELVLRWKMPDVREERPDLPAVLHSNTVTWLPAPSRALTWFIDEHQVTYNVNAHGFRARTLTDEPDFAAPAILIAGESVVFGIGIDYEDTFPVVLAKRLGVQVINVGVHGYGGDQTYQHLIEVLPQFAKPIAVVMMVLPEMVERNVKEDRTSLRFRNDGALELVPATPQWVRDMRLRRLWQAALPNSDEAVNLERAFLLGTVETANARGAAALFLVTNYHTPCLPVNGQPPWLYQALFEGGALQHVDVAIDPTWKLRGDPHPNARAHLKIAEALEQTLRAAKLPGL